MQFVLDPVVLAPPAPAEKRSWVALMSALRKLISEECVSATCPEQLRDLMLARWFEAGGPWTGPDGAELARVAGEVAGRLGAEITLEEGEAELTALELTPPYEVRPLGVEQGEIFAQHVGQAATRMQDDGRHLGLLGPASSWGEEGEIIRVEGLIDARLRPDGEVIEPEGEQAVLQAFLSRSDDTAGVVTRFCEHPCLLVQHPKFGARAYYAGAMNEDPSGLDFELGAEFETSVEAMNYAHDARYAKKCLRAMALVAAGRGEELMGHIEREGAGGNEPPVKDGDGKLVWRGYLAHKSSDAHRIFWVAGSKPKFLNVSGHGGRPAL